MLKRSYFAAANGYTGFRSYFDNIFNSERFKRIFVLKGGPGTGKSTLMKRIVDFATSADLDCDMIYCSSDPDSLDGVIVYTKRGKYAVIDGTAPHQRDAVIPGAIDIIVNLGDNFDITLLESRRDEILSLDKMKKGAYTIAYNYLHTAGEIRKKINELVAENFNYKKAMHIASKIESFSPTESDSTQIALRRAFCKLGYYTLDDYTSTNTIFRISGRYGEEMMFLQLFLDKIRQKAKLISFDPLNKNAPDGIVLNNISYICTSDQGAEFDAGECLKSTANRDELNTLKEMHDSILVIAQRYFEKAALLHSDLEAIYRSSIDFTKNDIAINGIIKYIL